MDALLRIEDVTKIFGNGSAPVIAVNRVSLVFGAKRAPKRTCLQSFDIVPYQLIRLLSSLSGR